MMFWRRKSNPSWYRTGTAFSASECSKLWTLVIFQQSQSYLNKYFSWRIIKSTRRCSFCLAEGIPPKPLMLQMDPELSGPIWSGPFARWIFWELEVIHVPRQNDSHLPNRQSAVFGNGGGQYPCIHDVLDLIRPHFIFSNRKHNNHTPLRICHQRSSA